MTYLKKFVATAGDYQFSATANPDGTYEWCKKLLNTIGAMPERIPSIEEVPIEVMNRFVQEQVRKRAAAAFSEQAQTPPVA